MNRTLLRLLAAVVLLGVANLASAQSSVTLYGLLDFGLYYQNKTSNGKGSLFSMVDGGRAGTRWGLRGTEDLGGGMHVGFTLESGFLLSTGAFGHSNGGEFGRQSFVYLDGRFGTVKAGLQFSPFWLAAVDTDAQGMGSQGSEVIPYLNNFGNAAGYFTQNAVSYNTPVFGGFSGSLLFAPGGVAGSFNAGKQESFSTKYVGHGLLAELAYLSVRDSTTAKVSRQGRLLGAAYTWGPVTFDAAFVNYRMPLAAVIRNVYVYSGGATWLITPSLILTGSAYVSRDQDNGSNNSILYNLLAQYYLSKRTSVYGQVGLANNHGLMSTNVNANVSPTGLSPGNTTGVNLGIIHTF